MRALPLAILAACTVPPPRGVDWDRDGHVEPADCDDEDPGRFPGAPEGCDLVDDDCDGVLVCTVTEAPVATMLGDPGGGLGDSVTGVGDLDGDGFDDLFVGSPLRRDARGEAYLIHGPVRPGDVLGPEDAAATFQGEFPEERAGVFTGSADVNGDGFRDVFVGIRGRGQNFTGGMSLWFGGPQRFEGSHALREAPVRFVGEPQGLTGEQLGVSRDVVGSAILLGAMYANVGGYTAGAAYLLPFEVIPAEGEVHARDLARATFVGAAAGDHLGSAAAAADLTGDGLDDLVLGARGAMAFTGAVVVFSSGSDASGTQTVDDADFVWHGRTVGAVLSGYEGLSALADVNGDGHDDLVAAAPLDGAGGTEAGAAYVIRGGPDLVSGAAHEVAETEIRGDLGDYLAFGAGIDFDNDGVVDLAVTSGPDDGRYGGVWVFDGPVASGVLGASDRAIFVIGAEPGDSLGTGNVGPAFSAVGDVDGDDQPDLTLGAPGTDEGRGAAYLFFGGSLVR